MIHRLRHIWRAVRYQANQPATALWRAIEAETLARHFRPRGRILDLGCGDGRFLLLADLARRGRWTGVDLDRQEVLLARRSGLYERVHCAPGDSIPERRATFHTVFSNSALEHMSRLERVIGECHRLLKRRGTLVFTVPLKELPRKLLIGRLLTAAGFAAAAARYRRAILRRLAHRNNLTAAEWCRLLTRRGFRIDLCRPYLSGLGVALWEIPANLTGGLAVLLTGGRRSPRQIQRGLGIASLGSPIVAAAVFVLMLPLWLPLLLENIPRRGAAALVMATKRERR